MALLYYRCRRRTRLIRTAPEIRACRWATDPKTCEKKKKTEIIRVTTTNRAILYIARVRFRLRVN